jgi:hypothetical protein
MTGAVRSASIPAGAFSGGLAEGKNFVELDLVYLSHDLLCWGARNIDGRGVDTQENRPTNLQIPPARKERLQRRPRRRTRRDHRRALPAVGSGAAARPSSRMSGACRNGCESKVPPPKPGGHEHPLRLKCELAVVDLRASERSIGSSPLISLPRKACWRHGAGGQWPTGRFRQMMVR